MDWHSPLLGPDIPVITCCRNPSAYVLPFMSKFPLEYWSTPKLSPCLIKNHTTRTYLVLGIPDLSTRCRCVVNITLRPLFLRRSSSEHPLGRRIGRLHNRPFDALETSSITASAGNWTHLRRLSRHCADWAISAPRKYKKWRKITVELQLSGR
jgi:hypothetical protein